MSVSNRLIPMIKSGGGSIVGRVEWRKALFMDFLRFGMHSRHDPLRDLWEQVSVGGIPEFLGCQLRMAARSREEH